MYLNLKFGLRNGDNHLTQLKLFTSDFQIIEDIKIFMEIGRIWVQKVKYFFMVNP